MQDTHDLTPRWIDQYTEDQAREILDLEDRIRDLEAERDSYREQTRVLLAACHDLLADRARLRRHAREQAGVIRSLRGARVGHKPEWRAA